MVRVIAVVLLVGCGGSHGPAWPSTSTGKGSDGGESLAPHFASSVAAAVEKAPEPAEKAAAIEKAAVAADKPPVDPVIVPIPGVGSDDPIMTDDIVIEVDD